MLASSTRMLRKAKRTVTTSGGRKPLCAKARTESKSPIPMMATSRSVHLDEIQSATASAREFAFVCRPEQQNGETAESRLRQTEKRIRDQGFHVRLAGEQDIKRLLAVYYQQDVTTEHFEDCDGGRWVTQDA